MNSAARILLTDPSNVYQRKLAAPLVEEMLAQFSTWCGAGRSGRLRDATRELYGVTAQKSGVETMPVDVAEATDLFEFLAAGVRENRDSLDTLQSQHDQYQEVFALAPSHRERCRLILEYAGRLGADKVELREDEKALGRWFGHDTVVERFHRQRAQLEQATAMALGGMARAGAMLIEAASSTAAATTLWRQLEIDTLALELGGDVLNFRVQIALCGCVAEVAEALPQDVRAEVLDEEVATRMVRLAMDATQSVWVQSAAIELLVRLALPDAPAVLRTRLTELGEGDDFFVRRRVVDLLASRWAIGAVFESLRQELLPRTAADSSPFVRQAAAVALVATGDPSTVRRELTRLATSDPEPSVRAAAIVEGMGTIRDGGLHRWFAGLLGNVLAEEGDTFVLRTALHIGAEWCERLMEMCGERTDLIDEVERTLVPIMRRLQESANSIAVRRWAANAAERVAVGLDVEARNLRDELGRRIAAVRFGRPIRLPRKLPVGDNTAAPKSRLGRVLAVLAQADFGFDVESGVRGPVIVQGGRLQFRLWRLLFEMARPSPEKRQAFPHTIGRVSEANLRVPSGVLAEVSPTRVPGEPLLQPEEQTWRPYLPLVDDLLSALNQWFWVHPVRFFTAQGITAVRPPRWGWQRAAAWTILTLRFHHYAQMRNWSEGDSAPADRYVRSLESLGFRIDFEPYHDSAGQPVADDPSVVRFFRQVSSGTPPRTIERKEQPIASGERITSAPTPLPATTDPPTNGSPSTISPSDDGNPATGPPALFGAGLLLLGTMPGGLGEQCQTWAGRYFRYFTSVYENTVPQLLLFALGVLGLFLLRQWYLTWRVRRARRKVRLSIGGWGTRGKSGTERLKAALINALGWSTVSKSTGCEAMFLYGVPWGRLHELGLYRPYEKATIWEHYAVLRLAGRLDASVFLWECMGLNPSYVEVLQHEWSRDDLSTITNAYPDHEDIQGPAGINVAETISQFIPTNSRLLTTEEQMQPVLARRAKSRGTLLRTAGWLESGLLTPDILARFPYDEHPDNIVLTTMAAEEMNVPVDFALKEMADRIVPDIGVLRTSPESIIRTRRMAFTNGMSANERHGCLGNWTRLGFDLQDPDGQPGVWISTVVNNRADRIARSRVFASILVRDLSADRHVLIGGNLDAMQTYLREAFDAYAAGVSLWPSDASRPNDHARVVLDAMARRYRVPFKAEQIDALFDVMATALAESTLEVDTSELAAKLKSHHRDPQRVAGLLRGAGVEEELITDAQRHLAERLERFDEYSDFANRLDGAEPGDQDALDTEFRGLLRGWFERKLVVIENYHASGDEIIDLLCTETPPGFRNRIMGLQNIKGTGLGFVYRWLQWQECSEACDLIESNREEDFHKGLRLLDGFCEFGILCEDRVRHALDAARNAPFARYEQVRPRIEGIQNRFEAGASRQSQRRRRAGSSRPGRLGLLYRLLDEMADPTDAVRRRRTANRIYRDLADHRVSVERAVIELRRLSQRQKIGWLGTLANAVPDDTPDLV